MMYVANTELQKEDYGFALVCLLVDLSVSKKIKIPKKLRMKLHEKMEGVSLGGWDKRKLINLGVIGS